MSDKTTDDFIDGLCGDLKPVKPLAHPLKRILPFAVLAALFVAIATYFVGVRPDVGERLQDSSFLIETILVAFIVITSAIASAYLSVPDARGKKWLIALPFTGLGIFALWSAIRGYTEGMKMPKLHIDHCMGEGVFMAVVPLLVAVFIIRKGATTSPKLSAIMNVLFAGGLGYLALRFTCMMDTIGHSLVSHMLPYIVIGTALGLFSQKLYKW